MAKPIKAPKASGALRNAKGPPPAVPKNVTGKKGRK
jgi:hypothetical protein